MPNSPSPPEVKGSRLQIWIGRSIVVTGIIVVGWIVTAAYIAGRAEVNLRAFTEATFAVCEFIEKTDGKWPESWDDLVTSDWEKSDFERVKQMIDIDFKADPEVLMKQAPEEFVAIRQIDKNYSYPGAVLRRCERVILTLRGVREAHRPSEPRSGDSE